MKLAATLGCTLPRIDAMILTMQSPLLSALIPIVAVATVGCSIGGGQGEVKSDMLSVAECMQGPFDLQPSFFSGVSHRNDFLIRIQRGQDIADMSDGLSVLVDDVSYVQQNLGVPLQVGLPHGVEPSGTQTEQNQPPSPVHMALYLHKTCHRQLSTLYALRGVIVFDHIFNADPYEPSPEKRFTSATFDVVVGDPRDQSDAAKMSSDTSTQAQTSRLSGWFQFYFERGQPGQPFP